MGRMVMPQKIDYLNFSHISKQILHIAGIYFSLCPLPPTPCHLQLFFASINPSAFHIGENNYTSESK